MTSSNNTRIAKNTIFLYIRMIVLLAINFYTTRVILESLGIDDFGLYNVVAGFVAMVAFINQSITTSIQRFLNYEIGKKQTGEINNYFGASLYSQLLICIIILALGETIGIWFVNAELNIPEHKMIAANIIYQTSIFTVIVNIWRSAFSAVIIAKEKMQFYAIASIIEGITQLFVAYIIFMVSDNRLIIYGILMMIVAIIITVITSIYALHNMPDLKMCFCYKKKYLSEILSFSGWNIFGAGSGVIKSQGINVLMNMFFGVAVNAARGISYQVLNCIFRLSSNFQVAMYPQIIQSYAQGDFKRYFQLCYASYKLSGYLTWILALPLIICTPYILYLWLGDNIPEYTVIFVRIILLTGLIDSLGSAISTPIYATGNIRNYQIYVSMCLLTIVPISYILYKLDFPPESSMYISLIMSCFAQYIRVRIWCQLVNELKRVYLRTIAIPFLTIITTSYVIMYIFSEYTSSSNIFTILALCSISVIINIILIYHLGLNKNEQIKIQHIITRKIKEQLCKKK